MCEKWALNLLVLLLKSWIYGDKINARKQMIKAGVPVISGSDGEVYTVEEALEIKLVTVMLKASAGGGGKGIRKVENQKIWLLL